MFFTARAMVADRYSRLGFQKGVQIGHRIWMQDEIALIGMLLEQNGVPLTAEQRYSMYGAVDAMYPPVPQYRGFKAELRFFAWGFGIDLLSREPGAKNDDGFRWPEQLPRKSTALWALRSIATPEQRDIMVQNAGG